jgi:hypothetical protein
MKVMANKDMRTWTFAGLERNEDGKFKDGDLAKILMDATAHHAGAFKARGTPHIMRTVEIMTITMARRWGVCTLNEFRKSLGLKRESRYNIQFTDRSPLFSIHELSRVEP